MNICFIGKYPPIEGQVSTVNFWLARALAGKHNVHFITNSFEDRNAHNMILTPQDEDFMQSSGVKGYLKLYPTVNTGRQEFYLPFSKPFVTKLSSLALEVISNNKIDIIFSSYLEPYAVAGYIASSLTDVPHVITHAGSDIGKLAHNPQLKQVYAKIIEKAAFFAAKSEFAKSVFPSTSVKSNHFWPQHYCPPDEYFNLQIKPMDINSFLERNRDVIENDLFWHCNKLDYSKFTLGYYGKLNKAKGIYDLVQALSIVRKKGREFNLILVTRGSSNDERQLRELIKCEGLERHIWLLPFIPNWQIACFIKACDAMCYLERDFPIANHTVIVPFEIAFCGIPIIVSEEIRRKGWYADVLKDRGTCVSVESPEDIRDLSAKIEWCLNERDQLAEIGVKSYAATARNHRFMEFVASWETLFMKTIQKNHD
jgi:glycosyltransferase involved in cell wall biosynthesis